MKIERQKETGKHDETEKRPEKRRRNANPIGRIRNTEGKYRASRKPGIRKAEKQGAPAKGATQVKVTKEDEGRPRAEKKKKQ